jgi:hypothetical protein
MPRMAEPEALVHGEEEENKHSIYKDYREWNQDDKRDARGPNACGLYAGYFFRRNRRGSRVSTMKQIKHSSLKEDAWASRGREHHEPKGDRID